MATILSRPVVTYVCHFKIHLLSYLIRSSLIHLLSIKSSLGFIVLMVRETKFWDCHFMVTISLQWRHNKRHGVSNQRRLDCLLNRLFRRTSPVDSPHEGPVTRKKFPFDDAFMFHSYMYCLKVYIEPLVKTNNYYRTMDMIPAMI